MLIKITPVIKTGQPGGVDLQEVESIDVALKQASFYLQGTDVYKFFVITKMVEQ